MTAKEYLRSIRDLDGKVEKLRELIAENWSKATYSSPQWDTVGGSSSIVTRKPEQYAEKVELYEEQFDRLFNMKVDALKTIMEVEDHIEAALLMEYYINGKTWEETSEALGYSYYHIVHRLHPKALHSFEQIYNAAYRS